MIAEALRTLNATAGPLLPFTLLLDTSDPDRRWHELRLTRHVGEYLDECLVQAQASIDPSRPELAGVTVYAIANDGYATMDGARWDAVLVEIGHAGSSEASMHAQRYESGQTGLVRRHVRRAVAVGESVRVGTCTSRLWRADVSRERT